VGFIKGILMKGHPRECADLIGMLGLDAGQGFARGMRNEQFQARDGTKGREHVVNEGVSCGSSTELPYTNIRQI
jgi:hypothetical protein